MRYISYELGIEGKYSEGKMKLLYENFVNKQEYNTFADWLHDMLKSGVFKKEN